MRRGCGYLWAADGIGQMARGNQGQMARAGRVSSLEPAEQVSFAAIAVGRAGRRVLALGEKAHVSAWRFSGERMRLRFTVAAPKTRKNSLNALYLSELAHGVSRNGMRTARQLRTRDPLFFQEDLPWHRRRQTHLNAR